MMEFIAASIRIATPVLLAALGGILSERAGVFAVGLEGMMLAGAFCGAVAAWAYSSDVLGLLAAMGGGALLGVTIAIVTVRFRADNMVTGLAANVLALGLTSYLFRLAGSGGRAPSIHLSPLQPWPIPWLSEIPVIGPALFVHPPLTYLAVAGCIVMTAFLGRTRMGLALRATGENPEAVFVTGGCPRCVRMSAVIACGAIAGLAGAVLSLQQVGTFTDGMTGGRGYLALASLIVGRWTPWGAAAACLVFGAADAFALRLQTFGVPASSYVLQMVPYLIALFVLASLGKAARLPAAIGQQLD